MKRILFLAALLVALLLFYMHEPQESNQAKSGDKTETPDGMKKIKEGKDFTWFSDNGASIMRNICLYSYTAEGLDSAAVVSKRDSVMRQNITGETDDMYMATDRRLPIRHSLTPDGQLRTEGTWEMKGDMMGGPFVCLSRYDEQSHRVIVAEAFLYAPDCDKSTIMKRLEEQLTNLLNS